MDVEELKVQLVVELETALAFASCLSDHVDKFNGTDAKVDPADVDIYPDRNEFSFKNAIVIKRRKPQEDGSINDEKEVKSGKGKYQCIGNKVEICEWIR